jgi:flagellar biosynthesis protein
MKKKAVALSYNHREPAPRIVAKGTNQIAELILKIARENGVHVEDAPLLAETLMGFEVGDYIPEEVYEVVAQILAFVYKLNIGENNGTEKDSG